MTETITDITEEDKILPDRLSLKQKFLFVLLELPITFLEGVVLMFYALYFFVHLDLGWFFYVGMAIYIPIDALNDFYFGRLGDRKKPTRFGRRTFFFVVVGPIWGIITFLMFIPWSTTNIIVIFLHFVISMVA